MFKRIGNQTSSNYQTAPSPSIKDVKARAEGFIEEGMVAYAAGDTGSAGHAFQSARFHAHSLKKSDGILQAPRRGFTPAFAAIVHRDLTGLNAVLDSDGPTLCQAGHWAIHYGYAEGLAAVGDRLNATSMTDSDYHIGALAKNALRSKSPTIVSALWGAVSEEMHTKVLNPILLSVSTGYQYSHQEVEMPDPETQRSLAMAAFHATWAGAAPSSEPR